MNFSESEKYLYSLGNEVEAMKLGLDNISALLDALDRPQKKYLKVQVAGTNGKGSVCAFLDSICHEAGISVGLYTSPHLISITERIKINGENIAETEFSRLATNVYETVEKQLIAGKLQYRPTFFEQMTAIALLAFADAGVEIAILETGLGGRYDATTAASAEIAAITRIDLDHQKYLGDTIEKIAAEKAAIIGEYTRDLVIVDQSLSVMNVIAERYKKLNIEPIIAREFLDGELGLHGRHQRENASAAVELAKKLSRYFTITDANIGDGLKHARHPGRLEYSGKYLFDGAHNLNGARSLAAFLHYFEKRPITIIFGVMNDKDPSAMMSEIFPLAERIILTVPENTRSLGIEAMVDALPDEISREKMLVTNNVSSAIAAAEYLSDDKGIILVTGSLYLIGEAKRLQNSNLKV